MKKTIFLFGFIFIAMSLIFLSFDGINAQTKLRDTPCSQKLKEKDLKPLVKEKGFFDKNLNEKGDFANDFVDNGDGTITDRATGLMWEQETDDLWKNWEGAFQYCEDLILAGHADWRMPEISELLSIVDYSRVDPAIDTT